MKPTQEQVTAWAKAAGIKRCDCDPRCHLHTGGMGSLTTLATLAYEASRAAEREAIAEDVSQCDPRANPKGIAAAIRARGKND